MAQLPYCKVIGSLMYAVTSTCPYIAYSVQLLSQYSQNPSQTHWTAALHTVWYLNSTKNYSLVLGEKQDIKLTSYRDLDWASDINNRHSISGYAFMLGSGAISWRSKKHPTVITSSMEAQYVASDYVVKEVIWLQNLLACMGCHHQELPTDIHCDNMVAIALGKDLTFHLWTKHITVKHHYVWEIVQSRQVQFHYLLTADMMVESRCTHEDVSRSQA